MWRKYRNGSTDSRETPGSSEGEKVQSGFPATASNFSLWLQTGSGTAIRTDIRHKYEQFVLSCECGQKDSLGQFWEIRMRRGGIQLYLFYFCSLPLFSGIIVAIGNSCWKPCTTCYFLEYSLFLCKTQSINAILVLRESRGNVSPVKP